MIIINIYINNFLYFVQKNVLLQYFPFLEIKSNVYRNMENYISLLRGNKLIHLAVCLSNIFYF